MQGCNNMKQPSTLHKRNMVETGFNSLYVFRIYKHDKGNIENNKIVSAAHMWDMAKNVAPVIADFGLRISMLFFMQMALG